jgi:hypothetical protein
MQLVYDMPQESDSYQCRVAHISANEYANGYRYGGEYGCGYRSQSLYIYGPSGLEKISQSTSLRSIQSNIGNWTIYENESL